MDISVPDKLRHRGWSGGAHLQPRFPGGHLHAQAFTRLDAEQYPVLSDLSNLGAAKNC